MILRILVTIWCCVKLFGMLCSSGEREPNEALIGTCEVLSILYTLVLMWL